MSENDVVLSDHQLQILALMKEGYTNKAMASKMKISIDTVKYHKRVIFQKLGAVSSSQAVAKAIELKFIDFPNK